MKALSLRQPWLWLVLHAGKDVENRKWWTNYRGPVLLHAAKGFTRADYDGAAAWLKQRMPHLVDRDWLLSGGRGWELPPFESSAFVRAGFAGVARITDAVRPCVDPFALFAVHCRRGWHMHEQCGFLLSDVRPMPFVPWAGSLGIFNVPDHVVGAPGAEVQP